MTEIEEQILKEEALKNAEFLTEEEENGILSVEDVRKSVLSEFKKLADRIDEECS